MSRRPIALIVGCMLLAGVSIAPRSYSQDQPAPASSNDAYVLHFSGEATRGQPFTRDIGHNLFFRLTPATSDEGGGWVIEILPPVEPAGGDPIEFAAIA